MAYVQLNRNRLDLDRCLFISVGGTPSVEQLKGVTDTYTIAVPHLHFDNDENGIGYDCQMAAVLAGKSFSISHSRDTENPRINFTLGEKAFSVDARSFSYNTFREASGLRNIDIKIEKAPNQYKDFNDIIMAQMKSEPNTELKQANARMAAVGRENAQGKTVQEKPASQAAEEDAPRRGRGL